MVNNFSPWSSMLKGQQFEQGLAQAREEGVAHRDKEALRRAAKGMGSTNYLTGYDGVAGAERPNYLKELYESGDPDAAIKMESLLAEPHKLMRGVELGGKLEAAKKAADYAEMKNAMRDMFPDMMASGGNVNAFAPAGMNPTPATMTDTGEEAPSRPDVGEGAPASRMPQSNLTRLPNVERGFEFTPQGPKITVKQGSDFERGLKTDQLGIDRTKVEQADVTERRQALNDVHTNVRKVNEEIAATQTAMQNRNITWGDGRAKLDQLGQELAQFTAQRDALLRGKPLPAPTSPTVGAPIPAAAAAPSQIGEPQFNSKEQAALDVENRKEQITAANKEVTNARLGAEKVTKFKRQVAELYDLVTKQNIGHPTLEGVPLAGNVLSLSRANAQVKKLNEAIINMFAEPGQSQMMNTIVERQMQGAVVPSIFTDPELNKENAAILRSNVEHLQNFPTFLERWQKSHNHTLDGAAEAWIDYTANNPLYVTTKDARGRVTANKNSNVLPVNKWLDLKASGGVRTIKGKTFVKQDDGSWLEK